ncbi:MAG: hypothetical protein HY366_01965 [Candidatus Aenigmarchaeota archaeon]|nr:hypothetical protein [Candidatus Aenigmarchaeota archaeon]
MSRRPHEPKSDRTETPATPQPLQDNAGKIKIKMPKLSSKQLYAVIIGVLFFGSTAAYAFFSSPTAQAQPNVPDHVSQAAGSLQDSNVGPLGGIHEHFRIAVTLDGVPIDFSRARYQLRDQRFHFEDGDGVTGHMHATGITLGYVFSTLGMKLDSTCFVLDGGREFCSDGTKRLEMFVNGRVNAEFEKYAPKAAGTDTQMDDIVITYG